MVVWLSDDQEGEAVRMTCVHVPSAWVALFVCTVAAAAISPKIPPPAWLASGSTPVGR